MQHNSITTAEEPSPTTSARSCTTMRTPIPRLYLGTMTFSWAGQTSSVVDEKVALEMLQKFVQRNQSYGVNTHLIDTARVYAAGKTEPMVGAVIAKLDCESDACELVVGTKANPAVDGGLSIQGITDQVKASLDAMNLSSVGEYYLHQPDTQHPLLESLQCTNNLLSEGAVSSLGMSNYHAAEMERAFALCEEHSLAKPTVYQGIYNPLNRLVEEDLLPVLRKHGCAFVAYNPLAAGLLAKKSLPKSASEDVPEGRFKNNPNYLPRFFTDANFQAVEILRKACDKEGISLVEASYRWLLRHSALVPETDGVLLGASSVSQLEENLRACNAAVERGPLCEELLRAFDEAWELTKAGAFPYWRSYSSDFPNRKNLDPGASYTVKK